MKQSFLLTYIFYFYQIQSYSLNKLASFNPQEFDPKQCPAKVERLIRELSIQDKSLLRPEYSQCGWLKLPRDSKTSGITRLVTDINADIKLAQKYSLALYDEFGSSSYYNSESDTDKEIEAFFGFGCYFYDGHKPPKNSRVIQSSVQTLDADYRANMNRLNCSSKQHVIFDLTVSLAASLTSSLASAVGSNTNTNNNNNNNGYGSSSISNSNAGQDCNFNSTNQILRKIFLNQNATLIKYAPKVLKESKFKRGEFVIAAHVKRGDLVDAHMRNKVFVSVSTQLDAIRSVILAKRLMDSKSKEQHSNSNSNTGIKILFITEQAPSDSSLLDYSSSSNQQRGSANVHKIDVGKALADVCNESNKCSVHVFTDESITMLQSFSVLCQADVLLTAASGFSHLAAVLCRPRLVVTVPFWLVAYLFIYNF